MIVGLGPCARFLNGEKDHRYGDGCAPVVALARRPPRELRANAPRIETIDWWDGATFSSLDPIPRAIARQPLRIQRCADRLVAYARRHRSGFAIALGLVLLAGLWAWFLVGIAWGSWSERRS